MQAKQIDPNRITIIPSNTRSGLAAGITLLLGLLALLIYWRGLAPSVATIFDDSLEFPLVIHRLGIAHPTGYPLYTLLGKLLSLFNPRQVAYQTNLMSALCGALAVGILYQTGLALRQAIHPQPPATPGQHAGAALGALLFGLGPVFYSQATIAEVYTLNALFVALLLWLTLRQQWGLLALCLGLSLTHHVTILLLWPAIFFFAWRQASLRQVLATPGELLRLALIFAAPLLLYLYLPLRGHIGSLDGTYQPTWLGFWTHISGGGYSTFLLDNPFNETRDTAFYTRLLQTELGSVGLILALLGLLILIRHRQGGLLILTGLAGLTYLSFNTFYAVSDIAVFFIPVFLILALWAGLTLGIALDWVWQRQVVVAVLLGLGALIWLVSQHQGQSRANDWAVYDYGRDVLAQPLPEQGVVVGILGEMTLLRYFQEVEGLRPDLQTVVADLERHRLATVTRLLTEDPTRAVYLTRPLPGAAERWSLSAVGPLIRVYASSPTITPPPNSESAIRQAVDIPLSPEISLTHYAITQPVTHQPGIDLRLSLIWRTNAPLPGDYKISARLLNEAGEVAAMVDQVPVHFAYPTTAWRSGELIRDVYTLNLTPDVLPGNFTPLIILYDPAQNASELGRLSLPPTYVQ